MKKLAKFKKNILVYFYILYNLVLIRLSQNIVAEGKVRFVGPISISMADSANLVLGHGVTIVSGLTINPLGRNIRSSVRIDSGASIVIGSNVGMSNVCLWAKKGIMIGNNVKIGADCLLMDSDMHSMDYLLRRDVRTDEANAQSKPIVLEDDVFVGARSIIGKGVRIGARSIVAAGSVVVKSIPPDEVWGGNPAAFIKKILQDNVS